MDPILEKSKDDPKVVAWNKIKELISSVEKRAK